MDRFGIKMSRTFQQFYSQKLFSLLVDLLVLHFTTSPNYVQIQCPSMSLNHPFEMNFSRNSSQAAMSVDRTGKGRILNVKQERR
jgi:hypothetical protein